jgi:monoamine oxidase
MQACVFCMMCCHIEGIPSSKGLLKMKIYIWRHSKKFSSWSMFDEPHIYHDNYMQAEVVVLAGSKEQALELLQNDGMWNIEELKRIEPRVVSLDKPAIVNRLIDFG